MYTKRERKRCLSVRPSARPSISKTNSERRTHSEAKRRMDLQRTAGRSLEAMRKPRYETRRATEALRLPVCSTAAPALRMPSSASRRPFFASASSSLAGEPRRDQHQRVGTKHGNRTTTAMSSRKAATICKKTKNLQKLKAGRQKTTKTSDDSKQRAKMSTKKQGSAKVDKSRCLQTDKRRKPSRIRFRSPFVVTVPAPRCRPLSGRFLDRLRSFFSPRSPARSRQRSPHFSRRLSTSASSASRTRGIV